jgi:adenosylcobinamide kinase/adenosylcobinamide-phosphate guanylyltransferase
MPRWLLPPDRPRQNGAMRTFSELSPTGARRLGVELGRRRPPRRTLLLGGARSGKSVTAERMLADRPDVLYVATGGARDGDAEWADRVALHRERRPGSWRTAETCELEPLLRAPRAGPLLVDCLALWLTAAMDDCDAWDDEAWAATGRTALRARTAALVTAWSATSRRVVAVSNEVGSGVVPGTVSGRRFRDELGRLNAAVATASDEVVLVVAGQPLRLKGPGR